MSLVEFSVTRNSPKWALNRDGVLTEFPINAPAFKYDGYGLYEGVLVEEAKTNFCLNSNSFSAIWIGNVNTTVDTNVTLNAVDGSTLFESPVSGVDDEYGVSQNITVSSSGVHTASFFVKEGATNYIALKVNNYNVAGDVAYSIFDITAESIDEETGEITINAGFGDQQNLVKRDIEYYKNGWYRCSISFEIEAGFTSCLVSALFADSLTTINILDESLFSFYGFGFQLEEGLFPSSYIPSSNVAGTRDKDVITLDPATSYIPLEGQVIVSWYQKRTETLEIGDLITEISKGYLTLKFVYTATTQELYINDVLKTSSTGVYDWTSMTKIELGHVNGFEQPNTTISLLVVQ